MAHKAIMKATQLIIVIELLFTVIVLSIPESTLAQPYVIWGTAPNLSYCYPLSPPFIYQNSTFGVSLVYGQPVNWTQFESFSYTLDGDSNCMLNYSKNEVSPYWNYSVSGTLENVANGNHTIVVHGNYVNGSTRQIWDTTFTVDTTFSTPVVTVISPLNQTYHTGKIDVAYAVDSPTIMAYYSIDAPGSRPSNYTTFNGSRRLTLTDLPDGNYKISFWVRTEAGEHIYMDAPFAPIETVCFTVDTAPPYFAIAATVAAVTAVLAALFYFSRRKQSSNPV
jgi:hypothetical protein